VLLPLTTVWLAGCAVMDGGNTTVNAATLLVALDDWVALAAGAIGGLAVLALML
jgi:hypothetical protein